MSAAGVIPVVDDTPDADPSYGMFTATGDRLVHQAICEAETAVWPQGSKVSDVVRWVQDRVLERGATIREAPRYDVDGNPDDRGVLSGADEVTDTAVREQIGDEVQLRMTSPEPHPFRPCLGVGILPCTVCNRPGDDPVHLR